jgi:hypothetical protein
MPNVRIVALLDGAGDGDTRRYLVRPDGDYTLGVNYWELGELDMGDPQTLADFVNWARDNSLTDHTYLAVSNHGGGIRGIAWEDYRTRGNLTIADLTAALDAIAAHDPSKIDIVHYDACLMSMLELAAQLQDHASYLVASQNLGWSVFAYNRYVAAAADATTPRELAGQIADEYFATLPGLPRTITALDLSAVDGLVGATDVLIQNLAAGLPTYTGEIGQAWDGAQKLDSRFYFVIDNEDEYIDLYHFAQLLAQDVPDAGIQAAAQGVMDAVGSPGGSLLVQEHHQSGLYNGTYWNLDNAHGLSIYYPPNSGVWGYSAYVTGDVPFASDVHWDDFLQSYFGYAGLPPEEPVDPGVPPMPEPSFRVYMPILVKNR